MSKKMSVMSLYLKNGLYRVIAICVLMDVIETVIFFSLKDFQAAGFDAFIDESKAVHVFAAAIGAYFILNVLFNKSAMNTYAAKRLSVDEKTMFRMDILKHIIFIVIIAAVQALIIVAASKDFLANNPDTQTAYTISLSYLTNPFIHSLIGMRDIGIWFQNIVSLIGLALIFADMELMKRRNERYIVSLLIPAFMIVRYFLRDFSDRIVELSVFSIILLMFVVMLYVIGLHIIKKDEKESAKNEEPRLA